MEFFPGRPIECSIFYDSLPRKSPIRTLAGTEWARVLVQVPVVSRIDGFPVESTTVMLTSLLCISLVSRQICTNSSGDLHNQHNIWARMTFLTTLRLSEYASPSWILIAASKASVGPIPDLLEMQ